MNDSLIEFNNGALRNEMPLNYGYLIKNVGLNLDEKKFFKQSQEAVLVIFNEESLLKNFFF